MKIGINRPVDGSKPSWWERLTQNPGFTSVSASVLSILLGLLIGFVILIAINAGSAFYGIGQLLTYGLSSLGQVAKILYTTAPLMMTGLAVGFAFRAGLFNIGATGQYTVGAFAAVAVAILLKFPWWACVLVAMLGGALWGLFPGLFKALFNVNEVITSIMFNWIALFLCNLIFYNLPDMWYSTSDASRTAAIAMVNPSALLPKMGLDTLFNHSSYANIGIFIAILFAVLIFILLEKTTLGYEMKACGFNRNAGIYAGIKAKRNIVLSMVISGGLAGVGGAIAYLAGTVPYTISATNLLPMGFNGIPVALLAFSHPIGIIISSLFIAFLQVGGEGMQPEFSTEMVNIILSVIIYFSAFALLMRGVISRWLGSKKKKDIVSLVEDDHPVEPPAPAPKGVE